jgi:hypothetical protein
MTMPRRRHSSPTFPIGNPPDSSRKACLEADCDRVFERYHRGRNAAGIVGTGVGLYFGADDHSAAALAGTPLEPVRAARMCLGWWMHAPPGSIIAIMVPGRTETTVDPDSRHLLRGTVEIESAAVLYIDVRAQPAEAALGEIDRFVQEIEHLASAGTPSLRGLAIAAPRASDALALSLAPRH